MDFEAEPKPPFRLVTVKGSTSDWKFGEKKVSDWVAEEDAEKREGLKE